MTSKRALEYLNDIAHGRKMNYDAHDLKKIIEKDLEALEILKKWVIVEETDDDFFPCEIRVRRAYISNRSALILSKKEYEILKGWLNGKDEAI